MTFQIEKETKWNGSSLKTESYYYVWADQQCIGCFNTEEQAKEVYEVAKKEYVHKKSEIIAQEIIN